MERRFHRAELAKLRAGKHTKEAKVDMYGKKMDSIVANLKEKKRLEREAVQEILTKLKLAVVDFKLDAWQHEPTYF
eukprot:CAMPEP_0184478982 /NCGR_PEP_ID=MMETSP0113_2-20130426/862_1 /TAXON_ID=91329 /ORGANISM="Norrisiella sphaerica, Strain BC52" /LENGTH=75 /DNA_ID=CAMNT_0026856949 /DNA_START=36 /DNA_END=266 /DNA_ORIENTATION=+